MCFFCPPRYLNHNVFYLKRHETDIVRKKRSKCKHRIISISGINTVFFIALESSEISIFYVPTSYLKVNPLFISCSHCVKRVRIRSYSGPHFSRIFPHSDWIRRDTYLTVFSPNAGKWGENADLNNFEYGQFLRSESSF